MKRHLRDFFIPHEGNEFRPYSLREESIFYFATATVLLFIGALFNTYILLQTDFLATIIPSVLVDYANEERQDSSTGKLEWNSVLAQAAQEKANDMAQKGYFAHTSPEGITPWYWFKKAGYNYRNAGENLAVYFSDSVQVHDAWMNSPAHRANILNGKFSEIGIATAQGIYQGKETVFVVELFGRPKSVPTFVSEEKPTIAQATPASTTVLAGTVEVPISPLLAPTPVEKEENGLFVTAQNGPEATEEKRVEEMPVPQYSSLAEKTLASPRNSLSLAYLVLFSIVAFALLVGVVAEFRRHHRTHMVYGVTLLLLLFGFYIGAEAFIFSEVSII